MSIVNGALQVDEEFFYSHGIGLGVTPGCFCCGRGEGTHHCITALVDSKEAGERIVRLFEGKGACLVFDPKNPSIVQVRIGACDEHLLRLERLLSFCAADLRITPERVRKAKL